VRILKLEEKEDDTAGPGDGERSPRLWLQSVLKTA